MLRDPNIYITHALESNENLKILQDCRSELKFKDVNNKGTERRGGWIRI